MTIVVTDLDKSIEVNGEVGSMVDFDEAQDDVYYIDDYDKRVVPTVQKIRITEVQKKYNNIYYSKIVKIPL